MESSVLVMSTSRYWYLLRYLGETGLIAKGNAIQWSRRESTSTQRTNYTEILIALETILGIAATPKLPLAHHTEFRTLKQDLVSSRRNATRKSRKGAYPYVHDGT